MRLRKLRRAAFRVAVGALLLAAAIPKILDPPDFLSAVAAYQWSGSWWISAALVLPWLELCTAVALLAHPRLRRGAWLLSASLFAIFAIAISSALLRDLPIECGCLPGLRDLRIGWPHAATDLALGALCAAQLRRS